MIKYSDFNKICRLCLVKDDEYSVDLFSKLTNSESEDEESGFFLAEMVEVFCRVEITKDDGLPSKICSHCVESVSALHKLQTISLKSHRLLCDILQSHSSESEKIQALQTEFVDTQSNVKGEFIEESETEKDCLVDEVISNERSCEIAPSEKEGKKTKRKKRPYRRSEKISCEVCGKLVPSNFIEFHLNHHKDIRPYKCRVEECDKYFVAPDHASHHYRKVHVNAITRPYKCDVCGRGFCQKSSLSTHRSYHFDPQIPCPICGQFYRNRRAIQRHLLVHSGERNYPCSECKKTFQTNFTLKTHMRTHTMEKPFSCIECTKSFAYKCLLKAHTEKHHRKQMASS